MDTGKLSWSEACCKFAGCAPHSQCGSLVSQFGSLVSQFGSLVSQFGSLVSVYCSSPGATATTLPTPKTTKSYGNCKPKQLHIIQREQNLQTHLTPGDHRLNLEARSINPDESHKLL